MGSKPTLQGKRIVITGGSMGIGFAVAEECARSGAKLCLVARDKKGLEEALSKLPARTEHSVYSVDVSDVTKVQSFSEELTKKFGKIDGLVNCAGLYGPIGRLDETDPGEFAKAVQINLLGTYYMCRFLIPLLKQGPGRGKIVNYSGGGGSMPLPNYSAYATSKAGIIRLTENMALELKEANIDVNVVAPGFVPTKIHLKTLEVGEKMAGKEFYENTKKQMESGNGSPLQPARLTAFLLSSLSDGISGKLVSAIWDP